jgi:hypothetical protein
VRKLRERATPPRISLSAGGSAEPPPRLHTQLDRRASYSDGAYAGAVKGSTYISGATPGTIALARATSADTEAQGHFTFYLYNGTTWDIEIQLLYATNGNTILTGTAVPGGQYVTTSERSGR